jgi:hypothetical protein
MPGVWGVDSFYPINARAIRGRHQPQAERIIHTPNYIQAGDDAYSLFDFICDHYDEPPAFWGRYVNLAQNRSCLRPGEAEFLGWKCRRLGIDCRLVPVYNGISGRPERRRVTRLVRYDDGVHHAADAETAARRFGVPRGVRIYADLEGWPATVEWLQGWCVGMFRSNYYRGMGGFYGRVPDPNMFDQNQPDFGHGRTTIHRHNYWSQELVYALGRPQEEVPLHYWPALWSTQPGAAARVRRDFRANSIPGANAGLPHVQTLLWQYAQDIELPPMQRPDQPPVTTHLVDLDVARYEAIPEMWDVR